MPRPENPLDPGGGPLAAFAFDLRALRLGAGELPYRTLAKRAGFSAGILSQAASGTALPSRDVTLAYVQACGGDPEPWTARWERLKELLGPSPALGPRQGAALRFGILGSLELRTAVARLRLGGVLQRRFLAALLLEANRPVPISRLREILWDGRAPASANEQISALACAPAPRGPAHAASCIQPAGDGYLITVAEDGLDALVFITLTSASARAATCGDHARALEHLDNALALWRGPALSGMTGRALQAAAQAWDQRRLAAREARADHALALGRHAQVVGELTTLVDAHPLREKPVGQLMLALHRCGRRNDALAVYDAARDALAGQHLEPSPALQRQRQRILGDDPALHAPLARDPDRPAIATAVASAPRQLPAPTPHFVGRTRHLVTLDRIAGAAADDVGSVVLITGAAGVGKTALALHFAHRATGRFPDGQLYANLRGFDPTGEPLSPGHGLRSFLSCLSPEERRIPPDFDALTALYRSLLAGRRMLILLDNARDAEQVRPLLPGAGGCVVIVTSRDRLTGLVAADSARPLALDVLSSAECMHLLDHRLGKKRLDAEIDAARELIDRCARLPLALALAAAHAAPLTDRPIATVAARLRQPQDRLSALGTGDRATDIRHVMSCSYRALSAPAAAMLAAVGAHPGPEMAQAAAASLAGVPRESAARSLAELARLHLLEDTAADRIVLHDLVHAYAGELAAAGDDEAHAVERMLDYYLHTAHRADARLNPHRSNPPVPTPAPGSHADSPDTVHAALAWFEREHQNLLTAIRHAATLGFHRHAWQLSWASATYFLRRGHIRDWTETQHAALTAARQLGDTDAQAPIHLSLSRALAASGSYDQAQRHAHDALALYRDDKNGQGRAHLSLNLIHTRTEEHDRAAHHAQSALEAFTATGNLHGQASAHNALGWHHALARHPGPALVHCSRAVELFDALGEGAGEAAAWDSLGQIHRDAGAHTDAVACYRRAVDLRRQAGVESAEAESLIRLGDVQHTLGDDAAARQSWQSALDIAERLGRPDANALHHRLTPQPSGS